MFQDRQESCLLEVRSENNKRGFKHQAFGSIMDSKVRSIAHNVRRSKPCSFYEASQVQDPSFLRREASSLKRHYRHKASQVQDPSFLRREASSLKRHYRHKSQGSNYSERRIGAVPNYVLQ